ncbi:unnamed protein product [Fraxinus pennsylvanica]|uniref:Terpene synthase metal-binding domain-containing protein n=1 Tax=Fraxinus pennsylvanica TaxID=56036 RepID=A0AAD2AEL6_9LAMI|nr:unnamed protein product [Fraxinus pennsylvanica]
MQVSHALELPLHWRVQKLEAKWFIYVYENRHDADYTILEFAKLDFNIVQAMYQDEIKQMSRWYKASCVTEKLSFARHRLVECFLWALEFTPEPQFRYSRRILTNIGVLVTIIDDFYDVYGSLDELELFTDIVERWVFIYVYENRDDADYTILEFAKLDFNIVQAMYQDEIKQMSRWYKESCVTEKLSFARHRLVECFLWALEFTPEPQFRYSRRILTNIGVLVTIIDDFYDVYGSLDELELFTDIVERWDINALDQLPEYLRICFLFLFNSINEMAYDVLKEHNFNIIPNARKLWAELCRLYLIEARWYNSGYFPSLSEYLNIAVTSSTGPLLLFHAFVTTINPLTKKDLGRLEQKPGIIHWPSLILRLIDDLGTSTDELKRGDVPKSIQCYMNDTGCSEEDARDHIENLVDVTLKKLNKDILMDCSFKDFVGPALNLAKISRGFYLYGDGFGVPHLQTKKDLTSLIVEPIPLQQFRGDV